MAGLIQELPNSIGFMGSDRYEELDKATQEQIRFCPVASTAIRFAIATTAPKVESLEDKLARIEPLVIATTYPNKAVSVVAELWDVAVEEAEEYVEPLYFGGSLESKPRQIPRVDGVFDIIDSGATVRANNLTVVADNLGSVTLGAVWRSDA